MKRRLEAAFGGWQKSTVAASAATAMARVQGRRVLLVDKPGATQTYFWLGNVGADRTDPARAAQSLVNTVFGGRFTSMLNTELRIKSGLSYGASSGFARLTEPGAFQITSYTQTEKTSEAIDLALATLDRLHSEGVDADSIASAKSYLLGQFPTSIETNGQLANRLADMVFFGLDRTDVDEYAARVKAVDVRRRRRRDRAGLPEIRRPGDGRDRGWCGNPRSRPQVRTGDGDEDHRADLRAAGCELTSERTALIAGATGLVGGECLRRLLAHPAWAT